MASFFERVANEFREKNDTETYDHLWFPFTLAFNIEVRHLRNQLSTMVGVLQEVNLILVEALNTEGVSKCCQQLTILVKESQKELQKSVLNLKVLLSVYTERYCTLVTQSNPTTPIQVLCDFDMDLMKFESKTTYLLKELGAEVINTSGDRLIVLRAIDNFLQELQQQSLYP
jgi:hypothetical protein